MDHSGAFALSISAEENRRAEDALERTDQPAVLGPALLHPKSVQHLRGAPETNDSTLLLNGKRREEDRHQPILPPRQSVGWVSSDLQQKLTVPALVQELARLRLLHGQPAEHERTGCEPQVLIRLLTFQSNAGDRLSATKPLLRDEEIPVIFAKDG
jgi:hypothetical protein